MRRTPSWLKQQLEADTERPHLFFSKENMKFSGDKMSNFGVRLVTVEGFITDADRAQPPKRYEAWELYRKHPVKGDNANSFFFRVGDFRLVRSARKPELVRKPREYAPRRASSRWLKGAPSDVLDLFHHKKEDTFDVLYCGGSLLVAGAGPRTFANTRVRGREMSRNPSHPQGVGMSFELSAAEASAYRYRNGKNRCRWMDLPEPVKHCIINDLKPRLHGI